MGEIFSQRQMAERASCKYGGSVMPEGVEFPFPSLLFTKGALMDNQRSSV